MTNDQFDCCLGTGSGSGSEAARLVLVQGMKVAMAAKQTGLSEKTIRNAMTRIRKRDAQIRTAYTLHEKGEMNEKRLDC